MNKTKLNPTPNFLVLQVGDIVKLRGGGTGKIVDIEPDFVYSIGVRSLTNEKGQPVECLNYFTVAANGRFSAAGRTDLDVVLQIL